MQISNKEPIDVLWDLVRDLYFDKANKPRKDAIPIYKETMHEESADVPASYILLRSQVTDTPHAYGDGKTLVRSADCDIILVSKGYADDSKDLHNINKRKIREQLKSKEINFNEVNLGFNDATNSTEHTFSLEINYIG